MINRIVRDGKVAVIYHPSFGCGWYSWHGITELLFDPQVVEMIEGSVDSKIIENYCKKTYADPGLGYSNYKDLDICWVPVGVKFRVSEYDGSEHIVYLNHEAYITA
jgi:hypothetical protein